MKNVNLRWNTCSEQRPSSCDWGNQFLKVGLQTTKWWNEGHVHKTFQVRWKQQSVMGTHPWQITMLYLYGCILTRYILMTVHNYLLCSHYIVTRKLHIMTGVTPKAYLRQPSPCVFCFVPEISEYTSALIHINIHQKRGAF